MSGKRAFKVEVILFLSLALAACAPVVATLPAETLAPTAISPTPVSTFVPVLIDTTPSPLPTQLTLAGTLDPVQAEQIEEIKGVLQAYFDLRYRLLSVSLSADIQQDVFGELVSSGDGAKDFLATETAKLAVVRKWAELNGFGYAKYEYSLTYKNIVIDASA